MSDYLLEKYLYISKSKSSPDNLPQLKRMIEEQSKTLEKIKNDWASRQGRIEKKLNNEARFTLAQEKNRKNELSQLRTRIDKLEQSLSIAQKTFWVFSVAFVLFLAATIPIIIIQVASDQNTLQNRLNLRKIRIARP